MSKVVINVKACKNILNGSLKLQTDTINIKYAQNGTGKSTIGEALQHHVIGDLGSTISFQSFLTNETPKITIAVENDDGSFEEKNDFFKHIEVFNEDFVNNIVFRENEAITDSFNVFIKTPDYISRKAALDAKLAGLINDLRSDESITDLMSTLIEVSSKFSKTKDGSLAKKGLFKDALNPTNIYNIPKELEKYKPFFVNEARVSWISWKAQGYQFAQEDPLCPFCAGNVEQEEIRKDQEAFTSTYSKSVVKNQKELEDYIETLKPYISADKYKLLKGYTREIINVDDFRLEFFRFIDEVILLVTKINDITSFSTYGIKDKDITLIETKLKQYIINKDIFVYFNSEKSLEIYATVNSKIESVLRKIGDIKAGTAALNKLVREYIITSNADINEFLSLAGINYQFSLDSDAEDNSFAKLIYQGTRSELAETANLRKCLSWGERNAISLVLFIYYANSKNADLFVLDDPISSFDKSKKFAIIDRLFKAPSEAKSLLKKTVLLLTHDFEPIIDLYYEQRFQQKYATASYLINTNGELNEQYIDPSKDIQPITVLYIRDMMNNSLNLVFRLVALRKHLEYVDEFCSNNLEYHFISSLLKCREKPIIKKGKSDPGIEMTDDQIAYAVFRMSIMMNMPAESIKYGTWLADYFSEKALLQSLKHEQSSYHRIQLLRSLFTMERPLIQTDDEVLKKYFNSCFHIENDYSHYLDYTIFDPVPPFISDRLNRAFANLL